MKDSIIKIKDLGLAAALVSCGFLMCAIQRNEIDGIHFVFLETRKLNQVVNKYWSNKLEIEARKYFDATEKLKLRIHSER